MIEQLLYWYGTWMHKRGFQQCPRCCKWKPKHQFDKIDWCMGCERNQRNDAVEGLGWLYLYSLHPDRPEFKSWNNDRLHENFKCVIDMTLALPEKAHMRDLIFSALDVLYRKLNIDERKVLW